MMKVRLLWREVRRRLMRVCTGKNETSVLHSRDELVDGEVLKKIVKKVHLLLR
jgi:hypothetical protein